MGVRAFLLQGVTIVDSGQWHTGKMTKAAFPLSKNNSFRLGAGWDWRVVQLTYDSTGCRLLVAFHQTKQNAFALFGIEAGEDMRVVCQLEHHSTHGGWHVHAACDHSSAPLGKLRWPGLRRIPRKGSKHKPIEGLLTKEMVLARALKLFRAVPTTETLQ